MTTTPAQSAADALPQNEPSNDQGPMPTGLDGPALERVLERLRRLEGPFHFRLDEPVIDTETHPHVRATAEGLLAGRMTLAGVDVTLGDPIDWTDERGYLQTHCWVCRHTHWAMLAEHYRRTGDERFVRRIVWELEQWHGQVAPHFPARGIVRAIDVGIRLTNWCRILPVIVRCEAFTARVLSVWLRQVQGAADYLNQRGAAGYCPGNHGVFEAMGVLNAGVYFPWLAHAEGWRRESLDCLIQRATHEIRADGVHNEQSPGYHNAMLGYNVQLIELARAGGLALPDAVIEATRRMLGFSLASTTADGRQAALSDSTDLVVRPSLEAWARALGVSAKPAAQWLFEPSGYAGFRAGDGPDEDWMMLDFGPQGGWHGHYDLLHLCLHSRGKPVLIDPGCHRYDDHWRPLLRHGMSHNGVCLDRTNYLDSPLDPDAPGRGRLLGWNAQGPVRWIHAAHDAYSTAYDRVQVERKVWMLPGGVWVVADRVEAERPHDYDLNWHLHATEVLRRGDGPGWQTSNPDVNLAIVPLTAGLEAAAVESWRWDEGRFVPGRALRMTGTPGRRFWAVHLLAAGVGPVELPACTWESPAGHGTGKLRLSSRGQTWLLDLSMA